MSLATMSLGTMSLGTMSFGTISLRTKSFRTMSFRTIVPRYNIPRNNVPHRNCSSWQLFLNSFTNGHLQRGQQIQGNGGAWIVANNHLYDPASSVPLQMVIWKEDCPPNDQNQRDGGARIVANDHLDDPASSVLFHSFAKRTVLQMTNIFWSDGSSIQSFSSKGPTVIMHCL